MSRQLKIFCKNVGRYVDFSGGESLNDIYSRIADEIPFVPICARVNNKTEDLQYGVFAPKQVEFLPKESADGQQVYNRSLCMVLYRAVAECFPGAKLHIGHAMAGGLYCRLVGMDSSTAMLDKLRSAMRRLVDRDIEFERKERLTTDVQVKFGEQGLDDKVRLLETVHDLYTVYYRLDGIIDSFYGALAPSTGHLKVFDVVQCHKGFILVGFDPKAPSNTAQLGPQEKIYQTFKEYVALNKIIGINNVGELNMSTEAGSSSHLIQVAEALHEKKMSSIADKIASRYADGGARVVLIAGPSSSGKTTFTKRLAIYLTTNLLHPQMISLDDYFVNRVDTPLDADGEYDFESLYSVDLELFNSDISRLLAGEEIEVPDYNFELGVRQYRGRKMRLNENSVLLIEGIHALNPELTAQIPDDVKFRIYVAALTTLAIDDHNWVPSNDNRLMRRIIRDYKYRGTPVIESIRRWPSVRRGEEKWILPFQEYADDTFNSSLIFELGVMRTYGQDLLRSIPRDCEEYSEAYRLRRFLDYFNPINERDIPPTSLLREFLGGSSFHY